MSFGGTQFLRMNQYGFAAGLFAVLVSLVATTVSVAEVGLYRLFSSGITSGLISFESILFALYSAIATYFPYSVGTFLLSVWLKRSRHWSPRFNESYFYSGLTATLVVVSVGRTFRVDFKGATLLIGLSLPVVWGGAIGFRKVWRRLEELIASPERSDRTI